MAKLLSILLQNLIIAILIVDLSSTYSATEPSVLSNLTCLESCLQLPNKGKTLDSRMKPTKSNCRNNLLHLLLILSNDIELNPGPRSNSNHVVGLVPTKRQTVDKAEQRDKKSLFEALPIITPSDYAGKYYCPRCWLPIGTRRSVSCDGCLNWTHLDCTDLTLKEYREKKGISFAWLCKNCREDEMEPGIEQNPYPNKAPEIPIKKLAGKKGLVLHLNCRSVNGKIDEIKHLLHVNKPDILILTETWLNDSNPKGTLCFKGYKHYRKDRSQIFKQKYKKNNGGGVAIVYKDNLKLKLCTNINKDNDEILWASTRINNKTYLIGATYRPDYSDLLEGQTSPLENHLQCAFQQSSNIMMIGDFNVDYLDHLQRQKLNDILEPYNMRQLIQAPTRVTNKSSTLIDHIWVSENCYIGEAKTTNGISDHHGTYVELKAPLESTDKKLKLRNYKNYDKSKLERSYREAFQSSKFLTLIEQENIEEAMKLWINTVASLCDQHAPEKEMNIRSKTEDVPWYDEEIELLQMEKNRSLGYQRSKGNSKSKTILTSITNKLKNLKRKRKSQYFQEKINEQSGNSKRLWGILREVSRTEAPVDETLPDVPDLQTANRFNNYFATIGKTIQDQLGVSFKYTDNANSGFSFQEITPEIVKKLIDKLKPKVATGYDRIPAKIIKDLKEVASGDIMKLVNLSYRTNTFPSLLKHAIIRTIYKNKGSSNEPEFYRPISVLSIVSKIFERSATDQIMQYLEENNKQYQGQHAYRRKHSTVTCLVEITDFIHNSIDKKNLVGLVSTDLSKAFDTLSHEQLLSKLQGLGFGGTSLRWIRSYLSDRTQQVKMNGILSEKCVVKSGVPQGSILGPVLFIAFTTDFSHNFRDCKITAYADDTQLLVEGRSIAEIKAKVERTLADAQSWFSKNSLKINPTKSEVMIFGKKKAQDDPVEIAVTENGVNKTILTTKTMKILGVDIDEKLTWEPHIKKLKRKTYNIITNLARTTSVLPMKSRRTLYDALVVPHYSYCDIIWDGTTKKNAMELQKSGNFAAKALIGAKKRSSARAALEKLNMMPLTEKRKVHLGVFIHNIINGNGPKDVVSRYKKLLDREHTHQTRAAARRDFIASAHRTSKYDDSVQQRAVKCWNGIPFTIRQIDNATSFKRTYQKYLLNKYKEDNVYTQCASPVF